MKRKCSVVKKTYKKPQLVKIGTVAKNTFGHERGGNDSGSFFHNRGGPNS